jgi:hypothetical protein
MTSPREKAMKLVNEMPDTATWDDIMYQCYVWQKIEAGIKADDAGETISHEEMQRRFPARES